MSLKTSICALLDDWELKRTTANNGDKRSIGQRYGAVVKSTISLTVCWLSWRLIRGVAGNVISLWDYEAFRGRQLDYLCFKPCLMFVEWGEDICGCYFDATFNDMVAHVLMPCSMALQMILPSTLVGELVNSFYFINSTPYLWQLSSRKNSSSVSPNHDYQHAWSSMFLMERNFFDIKPEDFELVD